MQIGIDVGATKIESVVLDENGNESNRERTDCPKDYTKIIKTIKEISDKEIPGFGELFRELSYKTVGTSAMQSRACAVLANGKYIKTAIVFEISNFILKGNKHVIRLM